MDIDNSSSLSLTFMTMKLRLFIMVQRGWASMTYGQLPRIGRFFHPPSLTTVDNTDYKRKKYVRRKEGKRR
jgi:hypothetical protein